MDSLIYDNKVRFILIALFFYLLLGVQLQYSVYHNSLFVYASFSFLFVGFCMLSAKYVRYTQDVLIKIWIPFLILTSFSYLLDGNGEKFSFWSICIFMTLLANMRNFAINVPYRFLLFCGLFYVTGVYFQLLFPDLHTAKISPLFTNNDIINGWSDSGYGLAGFSYQIGFTAIIIIYVECIFITLFDDIVKNFRYGKVIYYVVLALIIASIFLTGKRTLTIASILLPCIVLIIKQSHINKVATCVIFIGIGTYFLYDYIITNAEQFTDNVLLSRIAKTAIESRIEGADITSSRTYLYASAWNGFLSNPITGIGVSGFKNKLGNYTDVHNSFLQILCEQGIIGFVLFTIPLVKCLIETIKLIRTRYNSDDESVKLHLYSLLIQIVFICNAMTDNPTCNYHGFCMYFFAITLLVQAKEYNFDLDYYKEIHIHFKKKDDFRT